MNRVNFNTELEVIDKAIEILSEIPEDQWSVGNYSNGEGCHCAAGHFYKELYGCRDSQIPRDLSIEVRGVCRCISNIVGDYTSGTLFDANDGVTDQSGTPKSRSLMALRQTKHELENL